MEQIISLQITNYLWKTNNKTSIADLKIVVLYNRTIIIVVHTGKTSEGKRNPPCPNQKWCPRNVITSEYPASTRHNGLHSGGGVPGV